MIGRRSLFVATLAVLAAAPLAAERDGAFEGTWHGTLKLAGQYGTVASSAAPSPEVPLVLRIGGRNARVEFGESGRAPPGRLLPWPLDGLPGYGTTGVRMETHDSAALVYYAQTTGDWILTWQMSLVKTESDEVLVFFWQVCNFKHQLAGSEGSKTAIALVGELTRTAVASR